MDKLSLANIQALATQGIYGGRGFLQPSSAALVLSAATFLSNLELWQGAGYELTDAEIDDIQAMIAQLENDAMLTGDDFPMDKCQVTTTADVEIAASTWTLLDWDAEVYDPEGMHSNTVTPFRIYVQNDGLHLIDVSISWEWNIVGDRQLFLYHRDTSLGVSKLVSFDRRDPAVGSGAVMNHVSAQVDAEIDDWFHVAVLHSAPLAIDVQLETYSPIFSVVRL